MHWISGTVQSEEHGDADADVGAGGKAVVGCRKASHEGRHDKANAFWARPESPETRDTTAQGFVEKVFQLRATSYPTEEEKPAEGDLQEQFAVALELEDGDSGSLVVSRTVDTEKSSDDETVYVYWAKTHRTRDGWVKGRRAPAADLVDQAPALLE